MTSQIKWFAVVITVVLLGSCHKSKNGGIVGIELQPGKVISQEGFQFVVVANNLAAVQPQPGTNIPTAGPTGFVSCTCNEAGGTGGGCELQVTPFPGGRKFQLTCIQRHCASSCKIGLFPQLETE